MYKIKDLKVNQEVFKVSFGTSVYDALVMMQKENIGAVLVFKKDEMAGIFSERDYARKIVLENRSSRTTTVEDVMTEEVLTVPMDMCLDEALQVMTDQRIRHLPVEHDGKIIGMASIGDIVKQIITAKNEKIEQLNHYIMGSPVKPL